MAKREGRTECAEALTGCVNESAEGAVAIPARMRVIRLPQCPVAAAEAAALHTPSQPYRASFSFASPLGKVNGQPVTSRCALRNQSSHAQFVLAFCFEDLSSSDTVVTCTCGRRA